MTLSVRRLLLFVFLVNVSAIAIAQPRTGTPTPVGRLNMSVYGRAMSYGDVSTAIAALHYELAADTSNLALKDSLATLYFSSNGYVQSLLVARELLARQPNNQKMLELSAICYQAMGMNKEALEHYEKLFRLSNSVYHQYQIAVLQYQLQRFGECAATLNQVVQNPAAAEEMVVINISQQQRQDVPVKAAALNVMGVLFKEQRDEAKAKRSFEQALETFPEFALAKGNLEAINNPQPASQQGGQTQPSGMGTTLPQGQMAPEPGTSPQPSQNAQPNNRGTGRTRN